MVIFSLKMVIYSKLTIRFRFRARLEKPGAERAALRQGGAALRRESGLLRPCAGAGGWGMVPLWKPWRKSAGFLGGLIPSGKLTVCELENHHAM